MLQTYREGYGLLDAWKIKRILVVSLSIDFMIKWKYLWVLERWQQTGLINKADDLVAYEWE